mmetsp:Transcript_13588/g.33272  ORF Transcript_13588/g.33272 Transcript_13588/m.33272 type:complete len:271 (-) Transcript_13588:45-857(-)
MKPPIRRRNESFSLIQGVPAEPPPETDHIVPKKNHSFHKLQKQLRKMKPKPEWKPDDWTQEELCESEVMVEEGEASAEESGNFLSESDQDPSEFRPGRIPEHGILSKQIPKGSMTVSGMRKKHREAESGNIVLEKKKKSKEKLQPLNVKALSKESWRKLMNRVKHKELDPQVLREVIEERAKVMGERIPQIETKEDKEEREWMEKGRRLDLDTFKDEDYEGMLKEMERILPYHEIMTPKNGFNRNITEELKAWQDCDFFCHYPGNPFRMC